MQTLDDLLGHELAAEVSTLIGPDALEAGDQMLARQTRGARWTIT